MGYLSVDYFGVYENPVHIAFVRDITNSPISFKYALGCEICILTKQIFKVAISGEELTRTLDPGEESGSTERISN